MPNDFFEVIMMKEKERLEFIKRTNIVTNAIISMEFTT